jgi:hypothetical protein
MLRSVPRDLTCMVVLNAESQNPSCSVGAIIVYNTLFQFVKFFNVIHDEKIDVSV